MPINVTSASKCCSLKSTLNEQPGHKLAKQIVVVWLKLVSDWSFVAWQVFSGVMFFKQLEGKAGWLVKFVSASSVNKHLSQLNAEEARRGNGMLLNSQETAEIGACVILEETNQGDGQQTQQKWNVMEKEQTDA